MIQSKKMPATHPGNLNVEVSYGMRDRDHMIPLSSLDEWTKKVKGKEVYVSYFAYQDDYEDHYPYRIALDYEIEEHHHSDPRRSAVESLLYVQQDVSKLLNDKIDPYIFFSGSGGWHVEYSNNIKVYPSNNAPDILRNTLMQMFPQADNKPCMRRGLIRAPFARHKGTGMMKVPIPSSLVVRSAESDFESIYDYATNDAQYNAEPFFPVFEPNPKIAPWIIPSVSDRPRINRTFQANQQLNCLRALQEYGPKKGIRHKQVLLIASYCYWQGLSYETAISETLAFLDGEDEINNLLQPVYYLYFGKTHYQYSCNNGLVKELGMCKKYSRCSFSGNMEFIVKEDNMNDIVQQIRKKREWKENGTYLDLSRILGVDDYKIFPQESLIVSGDTGLGKSGFMDWLTLQSGLSVLKVNNELPPPLQTTRIIQTLHGLTEEEAEDFILRYAEANPATGNMHLMQGHFSLEEIYNEARRIQPKILYVDTTDGIDYTGRSENERLKVIMLSLNDFAKKNDMILVVIHHVRKLDQAMSLRTGQVVAQKNITLHDLAGSRYNVTKFQHVIAFEGERDTNVRTARVMKSNTRKPFVAHLNVDFDKWQFSTPDEKPDPFG